MGESKNRVEIDSLAVAYAYMIHIFRKNYSPKFDKKELQVFVEDLCDFADINGNVFVNKKGEILDKNKIYSDIMENCVNHSQNFMGEKFCYFSSEMFDAMRYHYQHAAYDFEDILLEFETKLMQDDFQNQGQYLMFEKYYKQSTKSFRNMEDDEDKICQA